MNKYCYLISLLSFINCSHAIIIGDEHTFHESGKAPNNTGTYQISKYDKLLTFHNNNQISLQHQSTSFGNATLLSLDSNLGALGITAAHCLQTEENQNHITDINLLSRGTNHPLKDYKITNNWFNPELYKPKEQKSQYDIGLFEITIDPNNPPQFFTNEFFEEPLQDGQEYNVKIGSFGPFFNSQLTAYEMNRYHKILTTVTYDDKTKVFHKISESRDFYFRFSPKGDGSYTWSCDLLPMPGDSTTTRGDSGSLVTTVDGKALALVSSTNYSEFYETNEELASYLLRYKDAHKTEFFDENAIDNLVSFINTEISDSESPLPLITNNGQRIYRFTLKEKFKSITSKEYFTPLAPYLGIIKKLSNELKELLTSLQRTNNTILELNTLEQQLLISLSHLSPDLISNLKNVKDKAEKTKKEISIQKYRIFESVNLR